MDCILLYYKKTPRDMLINHRDHFTCDTQRDGSVSARCTHCNKTLHGKNAMAHMRDHVATHTGERG